MVAFRTNPPADRAVFVPIDPEEGRPRIESAVWTTPAGRSSIRVALLPGDYVVEVANGRRFHEVRRRLPTRNEVEGTKASFPVQYRSLRWEQQPDRSVVWPDVDIPPEEVVEGMALFNGSERFRMGSVKRIASFSTPHDVEVPPFYLDPTEVTVGAIRRIDSPADPPGRCGLELPASYPVCCVSYYDALQYAEILGKRVPDESEYEFAATRGGTLEYPWGDSPEPFAQAEWPFGPAGTPEFDRTDTQPMVFGLYSNVAEWTASWHMPYPGDQALLPLAAYTGSRTVRGGPPSVAKREAPKRAAAVQGPRLRMGHTPTQYHPGLGFRCARSASPRFLDRARSLTN